MFQLAFSAFVQERSRSTNAYRTFVLDLVPPLEQLRKSFDPKWRNKLTGAEKNGLSITAGNSPDQYRTFCHIYKQMRNRKTFETTVDVEEFGRIQENLPNSQRMQILICEQKGKPVAGVVASAMGDSAIYLLGATSDDGLKAKGSYLLQWTLVQSLKEVGIRRYDLGGIDPNGNPGVYQFKRGFSGADVTQLTPLVACDSIFSSAIIRASVALNRAVRSLSAVHLSRAVKAAG